jgi:hypothetical protein
VIGRRLPVVDGKMTVPELPGDYCGPTSNYTGGVPSVFFLKPNSRDEDAPPAARSLQHVSSPPHVFRECPDGSLEIRPSIAETVRGSDVRDGWHGYLDEGHVWRKV